MNKLYLLSFIALMISCTQETPSVSTSYEHYDEKTRDVARNFNLNEFAFSFILNGEEPWVPNEMRVAVVQQETFKDLQIVARINDARNADEFQLFTLYLRGFKGVGKYKMRGDDYKMAWYLKAHKDFSETPECQLEITGYNEEEGIISGRFSGSIVTPKTKTAPPITYHIMGGVINNLRIEYSEDVMRNAKQPL